MFGNLKQLLSSPKRAVLILVIGGLLLSLPFVISFLEQQQAIKKGAIIQTTQTVVSINQSANCSIADSEIAMDSTEQELINLINQHRQQNGLPALNVSLALTRTAAWMAHDMGVNNNFSHIDSLGRSWEQRAHDCGYPTFSTDILAVGASTAEGAFQTWKNSPVHNQIMLNQVQNSAGGASLTFNWTAIGVGKYFSGTTTWWTANFGETNDGGVIPTIAQPTSTPIPTAPPPTPTPTLSVVLPTATKTPTPIPGIPTATPTTPVSLPSPTPSPNPTLDPNQTSLDFQVLFQGVGPDTTRGFNPEPIRKTLTLQFQLLNSQNQVVKQGTADVTAKTMPELIIFEGITSLGGMFNDPYYIARLRLDNTLWKIVDTNRPSSNRIHSYAEELVLGDIVQDNQLSLYDYNALLSCYGTRQCAQKARADLNLDGKVDEKDLNIFYSGLAKREGD